MTCGNTFDAVASTSSFVRTSSECGNTSITNIRASSYDQGHPPADAIDGNRDSYWSSSNYGASIRADLGSPKTVCSISIVWHEGDSKQYRFAIGLSNNGQRFTTAGIFVSSDTAQAQTYDIPDISARYVRITVYGNTIDTSAGIAELAIYTLNGSTPPPNNNSPVADAKTVTTNKDTPVEIGLSGTDPDIGDTLTFSVTDNPAHGTLSAGSTFNSVIYTPNLGYVGTDSFNYVATDSHGAVSTKATVSIMINDNSVNYDDFEGGAYTLTDGQTSPNQKWVCQYAGFGTVGIQKDSTTGSNFMSLSPKAATSPSETHAAAVATMNSYKNFDLTLDVKTIKQLRQNSMPNNWETAWLLWNAIDQFHLYGFVLKVQGFQMEKKDNDQQNDAAEIYLVTQNSPSVKLNVWQKWHIKVTGTETGTPHIEIWIDGIKIVDYIDNQPGIPRNSMTMLRGGHIVLYTEDAQVGFDNVNIQPL